VWLSTRQEPTEIYFFTALLFGLAPAIQASNPDLNLDLKAGGWTTEAGVRGLTRRMLVISEVALAMVLLVSAGLMIETVFRLQRVDPGFDPNNVITTSIQLPEGGKCVERVPGGDMEKATPRATSAGGSEPPRRVGIFALLFLGSARARQALPNYRRIGLMPVIWQKSARAG
jgi:hypothetical protein